MKEDLFSKQVIISMRMGFGVIPRLSIGSFGGLFYTFYFSLTHKQNCKRNRISIRTPWMYKMVNSSRILLIILCICLASNKCRLYQVSVFIYSFLQ